MLNVAVIGSGYIGQLHAKAINESDRVNLAAIAERNEEAGRKAAEEFGCKWYADTEEMLLKEDIDIVDICLPTFLHEDYVMLAARCKKHVLCEKPVALSVESFDRMTEAAGKAGVSMMVAQVVRFWHEYADIKRRYDAGEFGKIKMVYANRLSQHPNWTNWQRDPKLSGGGLYDLHTHDIDYVRYLFGPAESVYAVGDKNESGCWNHVVSSITFKNGVKAVVEGAYEMTDGFPFNMYFRITGENKTAEYNLKAGLNIRDGDTTRQEIIFETGKESLVLSKDSYPDPYRDEIEYFASCVEKGIKPETVPLEQSREVLCLLAAINESLETGKVIKL